MYETCEIQTNWSMEYNRLKAKIELLERNQRSTFTLIIYYIQAQINENKSWTILKVKLRYWFSGIILEKTCKQWALRSSRIWSSNLTLLLSTSALEKYESSYFLNIHINFFFFLGGKIIHISLTYTSVIIWNLNIRIIHIYACVY